MADCLSRLPETAVADRPVKSCLHEYPTLKHPVRIRSLWLIFIVAFLSACTNGPQPATVTPTSPAAATHAVAKTPTTGPTDEPALGVFPSALRGTQVTLWHFLTGDAQKTLDQQVIQFNVHNPWGIVAQTRGFMSSGDLIAALQSPGSATATPDLIMAFPEQIQSLAGGDLQPVDLQPYVEDPDLGFTGQEIADFPKAFWEQGLDGKQLLSLPALRDGWMLFYNSSWARDLGFHSPPTTPAEFQQQACAAAKANSTAPSPTIRGTGGWIVSTDPVTDAAWIEAFGGSVLPASDGSYDFNTSEIRSAFSFLKGLWDAGCAWRARDPSPYQYFANREALFYAGSLQDIQPQAQAMADSASQDTLTVLAFPSKSGKPVLMVNGPSLAVLSSTPARQLAAWLLTRWLMDASLQADLARTVVAYPVRDSAIQKMQDYRTRWPQWGTAMELLVYARFTPPESSWMTARNVLEDASTQIYDAATQADQIPTIVEQLDQMVREVLQHAAP
jgi:multiple sugar transport system substrate-binding protein